MGQKNIGLDIISPLIYTISPSSNPETRGEGNINNSQLLFPLGQPVCFYIKC